MLQAKELSLGLTAKEAALDKFKEDMWLINPDGDDGLIGIGVRSNLKRQLKAPGPVDAESRVGFHPLT